MKNGIHLISIILLSFSLSACGSGGSSTESNQSPNTDESHLIKTYFPNHNIESQGNVDADEHRQGTWTWYYDNGQMRTRVVFKDDVFDQSVAWIIYNRDSSIQADSSDGAYVFTKAWETP